MAEEENQYLHNLLIVSALLLNAINLASVSDGLGDIPETVIRLWMAMMLKKCHVRWGTGTAAGDHKIHPLPEHLLQASWSGDTGCGQPQLIALQTLHTTPRRSEWLLGVATPKNQEKTRKIRTGFPFFLPLSCPQLTQNDFPHLLLPALEGQRATAANCFSKMLQVKLSQLSPAVKMNFNIRNTASATTAGVQSLRRVPGRSTFFQLPLLLSPDRAHDVGGHKHRSLPPALHSPRTFASAAHSRCPPQGRFRPAGRQPRSAGGRPPHLGAGRHSAGGGRGSPPPPGSLPVPADGPLPHRPAHGSHTHLSGPAGSGGSACSRLPAPLPAASAPGPGRRPAHRRARSSPLKSRFSPLPSLARGRRFTWG